MAQTIKLKRSATAGNTPTTSQLALGELGINTTDGKLFLKKSVSGTESIVDVGGLPLTGGTLTGNLSLGDNVKAQFGASDDLQIYHDGSNSYISDVGTGDLRIRGANVVLQTVGGNTYFQGAANVASLYHTNNEKLKTTSTGIDVTGSVVADGLTVANTGFARITLQDSDATNQKGYIDSSGGDLNLTSQNGTSHGDIFLKRYNGTSTVLSAQFASNGDISFYNDSAAQGLFWDSSASSLGIGVTNVGTKLDITTEANKAGLRVTAPNTTNQSFGATIAAGTSASDYALNVNNAAGSSTLFKVKGDGSSVFSGSVTADGLTSVLGSDAQGKFSGWSPTGSTSNVHGAIELGSNASYQGIIAYDGSNSTRFLFDNTYGAATSTFEFRTNTAATAKTHLKIEGSGDISFYEDTGTTAKLTWSASNESLTFGTNLAITSSEIDVASGTLTLDVASDIRLDAGGGNIQLLKGGTEFGRFFEAGTNDFYVYNPNSDKDIIIYGIDAGTSFEAARFDMSAAGAATFNAGINVNGTVTANNLTMLDDEFIRLGNSNDFVIVHSSSENIIQAAVSDQDIIFKGNDGGSTITALTLDMSAAGAATFNSSVTADGLTVNGDITLLGDKDIHLTATNPNSGSAFQYGEITFGDSNSSQFANHAKIVSKGNYANNSTLEFHTSSNNSSPLNMKLDQNGNVNIPNGSLMVGSTTAPSHKLEVDGTFRTTGTVTHNGANLDLRADNARLLIEEADGTDITWLGDHTGGGHGALYLYNHGGTATVRLTADSHANYINNGNNFGIGTDSPVTLKSSTTLQVSGNAKLGDDNGRGLLSLGDISSTGANVGVWRGAAGAYAGAGNYLNLGGYDGITFTTGASEIASQTERTRIASNGTLYHGKTADSLNTGGLQTLISGQTSITQSYTEPLRLNRMSSQGAIQKFYYNGGEVGSIGTSGGDIYIDSVSGGVGLLANAGTGNYGWTSSFIYPTTDNARDLGHGSFRFKDLYLSNNATAQKLTLTKAPVGLFTIEVDGTNTGQPNLIVKKGTSEALRVDNNNNLLVGTASPYAQSATTIANGGVLYVSRDGGGPATFRRNSSNGNIITLEKDGTTVGSWQSRGGVVSTIILDPRSSGGGLTGTSNAIIPTSNAGAIGDANTSLSLGATGYRFSDLHLSGSAFIDTQTRLGNGSQSSPAYSFSTDSDSGIFRATTNQLGFATGGQEAFRIDASQNLLVGKTTLDGTGSRGLELRADGLILASKAGQPMSLDRVGSDGVICGFYKDAVIVGSIGVDNGDNLTISGNSSHAGLNFSGAAVNPYKNGNYANGTVDLGEASSARFRDLYLSGGVNIGDAKTVGHGAISLKYDLVYMTAGVISPSNSDGTDNDNSIDLGKSSARFDDIFATNGTIQTSDRNEKQDIEDLTEAEERVAMAAKGLLKKFRWKSAVEDKGDDARIHFGIIAQDLQDAFEAEGLDAGRYGMFISTTWTDEDGEEQTRMGVRYSELLAFIISAI
jgi:hypothetical protein